MKSVTTYCGLYTEAEHSRQVVFGSIACSRSTSRPWSRPGGRPMPPKTCRNARLAAGPSVDQQPAFVMPEPNRGPHSGISR
jgi:hypothetical protein